MNKTYWKLVEENALDNVKTYFIKATKDVKPLFDFPQTPKKTIDELFEKGKILVAKNSESIVGIVAYFRGVPKVENNTIICEDEKIAHVYCFTIDKPYRGEISSSVRKNIAQEAIKDNCSIIQFRAYKENNNLVNRLYSFYTKKVKEELNVRNKIVNVYRQDPLEWLK